MADDPTEVAGEVTAPSCYRHAGRETHIRCQRCDRPICPDCMHQAAVGFQCPDCVREGARTTRQARTVYGGRRPVSAGLVSLTLIGINAAVFLLNALSGGSNGELLTELALIPSGAWFLVEGQETFVEGVAD